ncbi:MAG: GTPase HflX [Candidatus Magnetoovum sp. WYHC-5]|nr:GTPase HflX [Candidatus Magnetoovum sp. WYHC-5]
MQKVVTLEVVRFLCDTSRTIKRQIGILIARDGTITHVIVGDAERINIPDLTKYPLGRKPLRGLRLIHTHLKGEELTMDDLTDLALLRLDYIIAADALHGSGGDIIHAACLMPTGSDSTYDMWSGSFHDFDMDFKSHINALEEEMQRAAGTTLDEGYERAILVSVSTQSKFMLEESMYELTELAQSSNIEVLDKIIQRPRTVNPQYLLGIGRLKEVIIDALAKGATLLVFDQDLTPSQVKAITDITEMKVIDRSQLILDIFARRAHSRDGKVKVELAQLKYMLPRLTGKGTAMSRLMGGIGGRGPGETKLEVDRRRSRQRINLLEKELEKLQKARLQRKQKRIAYGIPTVSIIGYTNAGKSTLLNALTKSSTFVEDKMFATLDTTSRRLRFPREREVIITDTVGFIRDLPKDLVAAFKSTLEELEDADLLLHIVDIASPHLEKHMTAVDLILRELNLHEKPVLLVFNKCDKIPAETADYLAIRYGAINISAVDKTTFPPLLEAIEELLFFRITAKR